MNKLEEDMLTTVITVSFIRNIVCVILRKTWLQIELIFITWIRFVIGSSDQRLEISCQTESVVQ